MLQRVYCACCRGIEAITVTVEVDVSDGICFYLVGLPGHAVRESQQRISAALGRYGFRIPGKKIIINLAPADIPKEGSAFDAAIAVGILCASGQVRTGRSEEFLILGELALDGTLRPVPGALPVAAHAAACGFRGCILPEASAREAAEIGGIEVFAARSLGDVIAVLENPDGVPELRICAEETFFEGRQRGGREKCGTGDASGETVPAAGREEVFEYDFSGVRGQRLARRGLEAAAAGFHNVLLTGPPGSGKTFMARCLSSILPPMSKSEAIETGKIYSVAGLTAGMPGLPRRPPFRAPHHTATAAALIGGGTAGLPGEVSLAHNGVLFLDELAEIPRPLLEMLRQPLEDRRVWVCRLRSRYEYPASFLLVGAMNPCPCGYLGDGTDRCVCSASSVMRYRNRISGPFLDRIDIYLYVRPVTAEELTDGTPAESSGEIARRVGRARKMQAERFSGMPFAANAQIPPSMMERFCRIGAAERKYLRQLIVRMDLSARGYNRLLKLSRTLADLDGEDFISLEHISEAIQFRNPDRSGGTYP